MSELPIEAKIHRDIFSLFYNIWTNKQSKIYDIILYLLEVSSDKSKTWSVYLHKIFQQYGIEDPNILLTKIPPSKSQFKKNIETRIIAFHENELRRKASNVKRMCYFNVSLIGLTGQCHPAISNIFTTNEVKRSRYHLKMLLGDFHSFEVISSQSGGDPHCKICSNENLNGERYVENTCHILISCEALSDIREKYFEYYRQTLKMNTIDFEYIISDKEVACQFILDPTSFNLKQRININDPLATELFKISRNFCNDINIKRLHLLGCRKE